MITPTGSQGALGALREILDSSKQEEVSGGFLEMLLAQTNGELKPEQLVAWLQGEGIEAPAIRAALQKQVAALAAGDVPATVAAAGAVEAATGSDQPVAASSRMTLEQALLAQAPAIADAVRAHAAAHRSEEPTDRALAADAVQSAGAGTAEEMAGAELGALKDKQVAVAATTSQAAGVNVSTRASAPSEQPPGAAAVADENSSPATDALREAALVEASKRAAGVDAAQHGRARPASAVAEPDAVAGTELTSAAVAAESAASAAASARRQDGVPTFTVGTPMNQPEWGQAFGERLTALVRDGVQQARIQLNPAHLGPIEVAIAVKDDQASVLITAQHAVTREALEAEMPRLRAMLGESGFAAVDVGVSQHQGGREGAPPHSAFAALLDTDTAGEADAGSAPAAHARPRGLVDHYV